MGTSCLDVGGVPTALAIDRADLAAAVGSRYAAFSTTAVPRLRIDLHNCGELGDPDPGPVHVDPLPGGRYLVRRGDFQVEIDPAAGLAAGDSWGGIASIDSCLRVLLSIYLAPRHGLLLHAAGVVHAGRAHVFFGPSGAGKTTVARLSTGRVVLSDELTAVHAGADGAHGGATAAGTPFWGELEGAGAPVRVPLAGLYRLVKSPAVAVERLTPGAAIRRLMPCVLFFARDPALVEAVADTCLALAVGGRCHDLRFRCDATFWELADG
ncbi:MAG: hypothetical protein HY331_10200 [Chloroflexi bacterium]|nr:hypothetical protein [Chloroflexota bacterium]